jgi:Beta propeller domain
MTGRFLRFCVASVSLVVGPALVGGCSASPVSAAFIAPAAPEGPVKLVAFTSCEDALRGLRSAARGVVGPYGFGGNAPHAGTAARDAGGGPAAAGAAPAAAPDGEPANTGPGEYSTTNTQEVGVDEPDLVKTDGRRIVTISGGMLRVVDAAARQVSAVLDLAAEVQGWAQYTVVGLLLHGDHALVLLNLPQASAGVSRPSGPEDVAGPLLLLVDLSADAPQVTSTYTIDGSLLDAREVDSTVRLVVRSTPRIAFPYQQTGTDVARVTRNQAVIDAAGPDEWLPHYELTDAAGTTRGRVDCAATQRPASYSGTAMLTVLTMDLDADTLGDGQPVTIVADGDTVYATETSLYVANDQRWRIQATFRFATPGGPVLTPPPPQQRTELYEFDTSAPGRPRYLAAGTVPGYLVNRYALGDWNGDLRVATTTGQLSDPGQPTSSAVYVLHRHGGTLTTIGQVGGLGKGQKIYAVRFVGPIGYVVTFRQTDPLYTVDLRDPTHPVVDGQLDLTGYSAYLHPAGPTALIGVGQAASTTGRVQGTQVSLFDVHNPAAPTRLDQYHLQYAKSEAEFDPHAFLYWPTTGLLVIPVTTRNTFGTTPRPGQPASGALILTILSGRITLLGTITHPSTGDPAHTGVIRRSLIINQTLWTFSDTGLAANDTVTMDTLAWLPS